MKKTNPYGNHVKRIGILGGTFDPVHRGHLYMAQAAMEQLSLDRVVFMVSGQPPHKKQESITDKQHRLAMLETALELYTRFYIDAYELGVDEPSYTLVSMKRIRETVDPDTTLFFIIGADSLMELEHWYRPGELMAIIQFAVIPRPGFSKKQCLDKITELREKYDAKITYIDCQSVSVSSTAIRKALRKGEVIEDALPLGVCDYINKHHLYGDRDE